MIKDSFDGYSYEHKIRIGSYKYGDFNWSTTVHWSVFIRLCSPRTVLLITRPHRVYAIFRRRRRAVIDRMETR